MKTKLKLSIVTVCFNEEKNIERTCKSISNQTYQNFEWIVVDGGSTDNTLQILRKYQDKITTLISEKDAGVFNAMNKGIKTAHGEYLLFLNGGDNLYDNYVLEKVFRDNFYKGDVLYGDCCVWNNNTENAILNYPSKIDKFFFLKSNINHQSTFIRKELFEKYGYHNEDLVAKGDYEKWLCFMSNKAVFQKVSFIISNFYWFDGISSSEKTKEIRDGEMLKVVNNYFTSAEIYQLYRETIDGLSQWKNQVIQQNDQKINILINSKSFQIGNLFFRTIKRPFKFLTFPINLLRILRK